jgi:thiamine pyrophosphate-dependent acetolactate synthase large subunit-like protein
MRESRLLGSEALKTRFTGAWERRRRRGATTPRRFSMGQEFSDGAGSEGRTLAQVVGEALVDGGVRQFFAVLGSGNFGVTARAVEAGAQFLHSRHENGSIMMAAAYTEVSGRSAACTVHQGPGFTNALTGLVECVKRRLPTVIVAAAVAPDAPRRNFYIDQQRLALDCGALTHTVQPRAGTVGKQVHDALRLAREKSLPLVLNVPIQELDLVLPEVREPVPGDLAAWTPAVMLPDDRSLDAVVSAIHRARRPVIVAGRGVVLSEGAPGLVRQLAERLYAPVGTTALVKDLFHGFSLDLGIVGGFSSRATAERVREADLVIAVGASLTPWTTRSQQMFSPSAEIVHISTTELDPTFDRPHIGCRGDAAAIMKAVLARLGAPPREEVAAARALGTSADLKTARPYRDVSRTGALDPRTVALELDRRLPPRTLVTDGGDNTGYGTLYMSAAADGRSFLFTPGGFMSIGLGLAAGVGAAVARPEQLTVVTVGDCGILMGLADLDTVARSPVPMLVVVFNDSAAGAEVHHFGDSGLDMALLQFPTVEFCSVASGLGLESVLVEELGDLDRVSEWAQSSEKRSMLVDVRIDPDVVLDWVADAFL